MKDYSSHESDRITYAMMQERAGHPLIEATPNADNPEADIEFIIEELAAMFDSAETEGEFHISLNSSVGSRFHARVKNAAKHLRSRALGQTSP